MLTLMWLQNAASFDRMQSVLAEEVGLRGPRICRYKSLNEARLIYGVYCRA